MSDANLAAGTTPHGTSGEEQAAHWVRQMFSGIAPKYDLINHILSLNIDRRWRKVLKQRLETVLKMPGAKVLDLCCGTGDVMFDLQSTAAASVMGADFCHPMLLAARTKALRTGFLPRVFEADALELPLAHDSLDAVSIAFGFRNLANYSTGLLELHRVLKPGGLLAMLEFSHPPGLLTKAAYSAYSRVLLPAIGTLISGSRSAYTYLPDSIRKFPRARALAAMLEQAGFAETGFELLTGGIAALHFGKKSAPGGAR